MKTPIILCADDYALTPGISRGIRDLACAGRLSATSAMTVSPYWDSEGPGLKGSDPVQSGRLSVGLHFTLTELKPLTNMGNFASDGRFPGLGTVLKLALRRRIDPREITCELDAQLDRFEAVMGQPPAYLDGHHHVHQLPIIRDIVIDITRRRLGPHAFVRLCNEPLAAIARRGVSVPRAAIISLLGRAFARGARRAGLSGNPSFRGVRDFRADENVARLFGGYLQNPQAGMLIMCHPGYDEPAGEIEDEIHARRPEELAFLAGDGFAALLAERNVELHPPSARA